MVEQASYSKSPIANPSVSPPLFDSLTAGAPGSPRTLAPLCDRIALSLEAGIDVRRIWRSETSRLRGRGSRACADVADAIEAGEALDAAIADAGPFFPPLMRQMVRVGEQTGTQSEVFKRLAQHYSRQASRAREFRGAIAWPLLQLGAALGIVGVMIAIGGMLTDGRGRPIDLLGLGLIGERGLFVYVNVLVGVGLVLGLGAMAVRRRPAWGAEIRRWASAAPVVGQAVQAIALARIAWALRLTMNVDMDMRQVAPAVLQAADNNRYTRHAEAVVERVAGGVPLSDALLKTGVFPAPFLDALLVAEQSGTIVETMDRLSRQYDEIAEHAVTTLTRVAAFAIWAIVACFVILLIFRVFSFYTGAINDALEGL